MTDPNYFNVLMALAGLIDDDVDNGLDIEPLMADVRKCAELAGIGITPLDLAIQDEKLGQLGQRLRYVVGEAMARRSGRDLILRRMPNSAAAWALRAGQRYR